MTDLFILVQLDQVGKIGGFGLTHQISFQPVELVKSIELAKLIENGEMKPLLKLVQI